MSLLRIYELLQTITAVCKCVFIIFVFIHVYFDGCNKTFCLRWISRMSFLFEVIRTYGYRIALMLKVLEYSTGIL